MSECLELPVKKDSFVVSGAEDDWIAPGCQSGSQGSGQCLRPGFVQRAGLSQVGDLGSGGLGSLAVCRHGPAGA